MKRRGCGLRVQGGVYLETQMSPGGAPVEWFLSDPPARVDAQALGLSDLGVKIIERDGVTHVFDIVGREHYPNVADFVEEVRRLGVSRRIPRTLDLTKLTGASRLVLLHRHAYLENWDELAFEIVGRGQAWPFGHICPRPSGPVKEAHERGPAPCAGMMWWETVEGGEDAAGGPRAVRREMPWGDYQAARGPDGFAPAWSLAVFAIFPIHQVTVIEGANGEHDDAWEAATAAARAGGLPACLEKE